MSLPHATVRVEVTPEDIAKGVKGSAESCPVALAIRRTFNLQARDLVIAAPCFYVTTADIDHRLRIPFPEAVGKFVFGFDVGPPVAATPVRIRGGCGDHCPLVGRVGELVRVNEALDDYPVVVRFPGRPGEPALTLSYRRSEVVIGEDRS